MLYFLLYMYRCGRTGPIIVSTSDSECTFSINTSTSGSTPGEVARAVETSLRAGYRNFDFAEHYANEPEIGEALQKCFKEGVVKREDIFVTSKVW